MSKEHEMSKPKTLLYIVRHGETQWNKQAMQQGQLNSPLSETGQAQAQCLIQGFSNIYLDKIYSSDLGRAYHTALIIAESKDMTITQDPRLRERHLGIMQGLTKEQFKEQYPQEWKSFISEDPDYILPQGESARQRQQRSVTALEEIARKHGGETLLVVTHGGVLQGLFRQVLGLPQDKPRHFSLFNGAINRFSYSQQSGWTLDSWGEISHMKGLEVLDDN
jgi:probable phosphoglycerate mutase